MKLITSNDHSVMAKKISHTYRERAPKVAEWLEENLEEGLTTFFPKTHLEVSHQQSLKTGKPRAEKEAAGSNPFSKPALLFAEIHEEWVAENV